MEFLFSPVKYSYWKHHHSWKIACPVRTEKKSLTETWVFNRGPLLELFWMDHRLLFQWPQEMPISPGLSVFISPTACLSHTLSGSVHWSSCCSLQNTSIGQSGSNCLLRDIKAPKRLVHLLCSGIGQKEEEQQEEKLLWTPLPASVYSLSF